ncbi:MAG: hypoxanthine phosphoribosyltransferase [Bacteroidota bacterium]
MSSPQIQLKDKTFIPYLNTQQIHETVKRLASQINEEYHDKKPLFVCILSGSFMFCSDLVKNFCGDCEITFVRLSSYSGTQSTGNITTLMGMVESLTDRHVIIVEDIVDTGNTLSKFLPEVQALQPASLKVCSLLVKPDALQDRIKVDFIGFSIPNDFIVGYGLDYDGLGRNLQEIYVIKP